MGCDDCRGCGCDRSAAPLYRSAAAEALQVRDRYEIGALLGGLQGTHATWDARPSVDRLRTVVRAIHHPKTVLLLGLMIAHLGAELIGAAYAARFRDTLEAIEAETRARPRTFAASRMTQTPVTAELKP